MQPEVSKHAIKIRRRDQEKTIYVGRDEFVFGSDAQASDIQISDSNISPRHVSVKITGDQVQIRDLGSQNGTFVGGVKLKLHESVTLSQAGETWLLGDNVWITIVPRKVEAATRLQAPVLGKVSVPIPDDLRAIAMLEIEAIQDGAVKFSEALREEARKEATLIIGKAEEIKRKAEEHKVSSELSLHLTKKQVEELNREHQRFEERISGQKQVLESKEREFAELQESKSKVETTILQLKKNQADYEKELFSAQEQLTSLKDQIDSKQEVIRGYEEEITTQQQALSNIKDEIHHQTELLAFEDKKNKANYELLGVEFRAKKLSLESSLGDLEGKAGSMQRELQDLIQQRDAVLGEINNFRISSERQFERAGERLLSFEAEAARVSAKVESQKEASERIKDEIAAQQSLLGQLTFERKSLLTDIESIREDLRQSQIALSEFKSRSELEMNQIRGDLEKLIDRRSEVTSVEKDVQQAHEALEKERLESLNLQNEIAERQKTIASLQEAENSSIEKAKALQQSLDDLGADMEHARQQAFAQLNEEEKQRKNTLEREFVARKDLLEREVREAREADMKQLTALKTDAQKEEKARKSLILEEIVRNAVELSRIKPLDHSIEELRAAVQDVLDGKSRGSLSAKAAERSRKFWIRIGAWASGPAAVAATLALFPNIPDQVRSHLARTVASETKESGGVFLEEVRKKGLKFQPAVMDTHYRDTYADNIIYVSGYVEMKLSETERKEWTLLLNDFIVGRLGLSDRVIPDFIATETVMIKELLDVRKGIIPEYKEQGFAQMNEIEKKDVDKIKLLLQDDANYSKFRDLEKSFYQEFLSKNPVPSK